MLSLFPMLTEVHPSAFLPHSSTHHTTYVVTQTMSGYGESVENSTLTLSVDDLCCVSATQGEAG